MTLQATRNQVSLTPICPFRDASGVPFNSFFVSLIKHQERKTMPLHQFKTEKNSTTIHTAKAPCLETIPELNLMLCTLYRHVLHFVFIWTQSPHYPNWINLNNSRDYKPKFLSVTAHKNSKRRETTFLPKK